MSPNPSVLSTSPPCGEKTLHAGKGSLLPVLVLLAGCGLSVPAVLATEGTSPPANSSTNAKGTSPAFQKTLKAARQGDIQAQRNLAVFYATGIGVNQDDKEALNG
ncbi:MAG: hypothetical protein ACLSUW_00545 [Akkermansia sp.]